MLPAQMSRCTWQDISCPTDLMRTAQKNNFESAFPGLFCPEKSAADRAIRLSHKHFVDHSPGHFRFKRFSESRHILSAKIPVMTVVLAMRTTSRPFVEDVIKTYFEMGTNALERKEYAIAIKMFKAVLEEPCAKTQKERLMFLLLIKSAEAYEGLKQLYKAKLFYIRALAWQKSLPEAPTGQTVQILLTLSNLSAQQGLYRQSVDFAVEAFETYRCSKAKDPASFVCSLRRNERIMQLKGRTAEQQKLLQILQQAKTEALMAIPGVAAVLPAAITLPF